MKPPYSLLLVCAVALTACSVQPTTIAQQRSITVGPNEPDARSFRLAQVALQIPLGSRIQNTHYGWGCFPGQTHDWRGGTINLTDEEMLETFRNEFTGANYKVAGNPKALIFDQATQSADLLIAGAIEKLEINVCFPFSGVPSANVGITSQIKGSIYMRARWQVFDTTLGKIVFETSTEGSFASPDTISGSVPEFLKLAFRANIRNLLAETALYELAKRDKAGKSVNRI